LPFSSVSPPCGLLKRIIKDGYPAFEIEGDKSKVDTRVDNEAENEAYGYEITE